MSTLKNKLTSRKFWTMVVGVIVGLAAAFGLSENEWGQIAGVVGSIVSGVVYILAEGKVDTERIANSAPINISIDDTSDMDDGK